MDFLKTYFDYITNKRLRGNKLLKLYTNGVDMLEDELNIVNIIKNLKYYRIIMEDYLINSEKMRFDIEYHSNNAIDLDSDEESNSYANRLRINP